MYKFEGRVAVITGAGRGIGKGVRSAAWRNGAPASSSTTSGAPGKVTEGTTNRLPRSPPRSVPPEEARRRYQ